jgi:hypothetical protein
MLPEGENYEEIEIEMLQEDSLQQLMKLIAKCKRTRKITIKT